MKPLTLLFAIALACASLGQITPFEFGLGYGQSGSFSRTSGGRGRIEGLELSGSQAILNLPIAGEVRFGASVLIDGGLNGNGEDGRVYRLFAHYRSPSAGPEGWYVIAGPYWGRAQGRSRSFESFDRSGVDLGLGLPIGSPLPGIPGASLELVNHQSSRAQLRGWTLALKVRL